MNRTYAILLDGGFVTRKLRERLEQFPTAADVVEFCSREITGHIQQAAALLVLDETTFVSSAALEQAKGTIADRERTLLSAEDREVIPAALDTPAEPADALRQAPGSAQE